MVAYFLSKKLAERKHSVEMLIRVKGEDELERLESTEEYGELSGNVSLTPVKIRYDLLSLANLPRLLHIIYNVTRLFNPSLYDVVLYNSPPVDVTLLYPGKALGKAKQVMVIHGGLFYELKNYVGKALIRLQLGRFDRVVALSRFTEEIALKFGFRRKQVVKIPNGVDPGEFDRVEPLDLEGDPVLLYAGRLDRIKGVDLLLRAYREIVEEYPSSKLYIVGDGSEYGRLASLAKDIGVYDRVVFTGFIDSIRVVHRYIKSADIFILPSYRENFSIALLEAMAAKTPLVVSDNDGNRDVLDVGEAMFFKNGDWRDLREKLSILIGDEGMRRKIAEKARSRVMREYNWDNIVSKYEELFISLLD